MRYSVLIFLSNPDAPEAALFHSAIVESGPLAMNFKGPEEAETLARTFASKLGCAYDDQVCHQSKNTSEILKATKDTVNIPLSWSDAIQMWAPIVTGPGTSFAMQPVKAFETGC